MFQDAGSVCDVAEGDFGVAFRAVGVVQEVKGGCWGLVWRQRGSTGDSGVW